MKLIYNPQFETDLQEVTDYIAKDSPTRAVRLGEKIFAECMFVASHPRLFRERPDIRRHLRVARVGKYAIISAIEK